MRFRKRAALGTQLIIQPANDEDHVNRTWQAQPVIVAMSASTVITCPASGTVSDFTDGSHVEVQGTWSGETLAATQVDIEAAGPSIPANAPKPGQASPGAMPPMVTGTVTGAHDGSFTMDTQTPPGGHQALWTL